VPYKSTAASSTAVLSERRTSGSSRSTALGHIEAGRRARLGVAGAARLPMLPTCRRSRGGGRAGVVLTSCFGAIAPAGAAADRRADGGGAEGGARGPGDGEALEDLTFGAAWSGPDDFRALAESEIRRWGPIIESASVPKQ
jgi:tripartite-type tricarboxylate transporter receptor subunit TctC